MMRCTFGRAMFGVALLSMAASACVLKADGFTGGNGAPAGPDGGSSSEGGSSSGSASSSGSPTGDGGGSTSSGSTGDPGGANLLLNGDFELGCAGWDVAFGFVSESTATFHGGTRSCKFCMDTNFEAELNRDVKGLGGKAGQTYAAEVWMHSASSVDALKTAGYSGSALALETPLDHPSATDGPPLDGSWQRLTSLITLSKDVDTMNYTIHLQQEGNPAQQGNVICVFVDDAVLKLLK